MDFDNQLLFFFSALGAFNSLLLSLYFLFFARPKHNSNIFLGALLAVLGIRIGKSVFFYFNPELSKVYLQIGLSACFLIGPFLYFYIKSKTTSTANNNTLWILQPILLVLFVAVIGLLYPYSNNIELWGNYFNKIIYYVWLLFIILSALLLKRQFTKTFSSEQKINYDDTWVLSVFLGVFLIWVAYFTSSYTSYILGALSLSFILFLTALLLLHKKRNQGKISTPEKYVNQKILAPEAEELFSKIDTLINEKELYKNANLTLPLLAKQLHIRTHLLSQFINDNLNKNFPQFINEYRIEEAKRLLNSNSNLKIEVIAENCGFNSNSTFYTAFKKITNTTPSKFLNKG